MSKIVEYTLGFAFDESFTSVLLIQKNRPEWQAGKLNGIGGKVEGYDENEFHAQAREFREEAGINTQPEDWKIFASMYSSDFIVDCFWTTLKDINAFRSVTDEIVNSVSIRRLSECNKCPNVDMLIAMALNEDVRSGKISPLMINYAHPGFTS
jgi:8-oxo-dGTP diphosphatase